MVIGRGTNIGAQIQIQIIEDDTEVESVLGAITKIKPNFSVELSAGKGIAIVTNKGGSANHKV